MKFVVQFLLDRQGKQTRRITTRSTVWETVCVTTRRVKAEVAMKGSMVDRPGALHRIREVRA